VYEGLIIIDYGTTLEYFGDIQPSAGGGIWTIDAQCSYLSADLVQPKVHHACAFSFCVLRVDITYADGTDGDGGIE
jgi:hypothetical protein